MANCCEDKGCEIAALRERHGRVLWIVLGINAAMFFIEGSAGILARSTSLLADALDMLGDALVYGFSLFVLARSLRWQVSAALFKGAVMRNFSIRKVECRDIGASKQEIAARYEASPIEVSEHR
jgi:hypothetical protein